MGAATGAGYGYYAPPPPASPGRGLGAPPPRRNSAAGIEHDFQENPTMKKVQYGMGGATGVVVGAKVPAASGLGWAGALVGLAYGLGMTKLRRGMVQRDGTQPEMHGSSGGSGLFWILLFGFIVFSLGTLVTAVICATARGIGRDTNDEVESYKKEFFEEQEKARKAALKEMLSCAVSTTSFLHLHAQPVYPHSYPPPGVVHGQPPPPPGVVYGQPPPPPGVVHGHPGGAYGHPAPPGRSPHLQKSQVSNSDKKGIGDLQDDKTMKAVQYGAGAGTGAYVGATVPAGAGLGWAGALVGVGYGLAMTKLRRGMIANKSGPDLETHGTRTGTSAFWIILGGVVVLGVFTIIGAVLCATMRGVGRDISDDIEDYKQEFYDQQAKARKEAAKEVRHQELLGKL